MTSRSLATVTAAHPPAHHVAGAPPARVALLTASGRARADTVFATVTAI